MASAMPSRVNAGCSSNRPGSLNGLRIPKRYEHCTLDTFEPGYGQADQSLAMAFNTARRFVYEYPVATEGTRPFAHRKHGCRQDASGGRHRPGVDFG